jgi:hypothetical protein
MVRKIEEEGCEVRMQYLIFHWLLPLTHCEDIAVVYARVTCATAFASRIRGPPGTPAIKAKGRKELK